MGANKKVPMRKCVGCQEMKSKKEMIRVIRTSEGEFLLDATGRKNGRGAYLCPDSNCLAKAVKNKGLERSFKQAIPKEVYEALVEKGYNPINQIVGYILSGDPTYITSHNNARNKIRTLERDELLEKMVKSYIGLGLEDE